MSYSTSGILEENSYYPFGLRHGGYHLILGDINYQYKYNGKELQTETGMYDYGARFYMPDLGRWGVVDPLAEKYYPISPYNYVANNPIKFIDVDGRDIIVPKYYQANFNKALTSIFGNHAKSFSYDDNGKLSFTGNIKDLNKDQKYVYKQMEKLMTSRDITNIIYEKIYTIMDNKNNNINVDASQSGGETTILKLENPNFSKNYVIIDPNGASSINVMEVTDNYYSSKGSVPQPGDPPNFKPAKVATNPENATWHGLGHVIFAGKSQDKVIDFDNRTRKMMSPPLPPRNMDETHNKTVIKGTGTLWEID